VPELICWNEHPRPFWLEMCRMYGIDGKPSHHSSHRDKAHRMACVVQFTPSYAAAATTAGELSLKAVKWSWRTHELIVQLLGRHESLLAVSGALLPAFGVLLNFSTTNLIRKT
jgi:hypothetical protein